MSLSLASRCPFIVVTDLDGTLLDHHDYSFAPILPVLDQLREIGVPVVANTSKTRAEWLVMRDAFSNADAFVVENGSGLHLPDGSREVFGASRREILDFLAPMRADYQFEGFADWSTEQVVEATGLATGDAERSMQREFSEPLTWKDSEDKRQEFIRTVEGQGFMCLQGGRFLHVLGTTNKARPLPMLKEFYNPSAPIVVLGDSQNDLAMLAAADYPVLISNPSAKSKLAGEVAVLPNGRVSEKAGPAGWAEEVTRLIARLT